MTKQTIAVIFGGKSAEHDVSIITAIMAVIKPLTLTGKYTILPVYITKTGQWFSDPKLADVQMYQNNDIETFLKTKKRLQFEFDDGLYFITSGIRPKKQKIDLVFPAMHGTFGEDGSLMGFLRMAGVPFVGCDLAASAIAMDKVYTKQIVSNAGLPIVSFTWATKHAFLENGLAAFEGLEALTYPLFVKPAHLGSSIGITRVNSKNDLQNALEVAFHYDDKVLVEEGVNNLIEVTVPVMGTNSPIPALVEESVLSKDGVFDFDTKYMRGGKKGSKTPAAAKSAQGYSHLPARLSEALYAQSESAAIETFKAIGCGGLARVDLLIDSKTNKIFVNEVNTLPGSLYAHNWKAAGYSGVDLVEKLIGYAQERYEEQQELAFSFDTNFLKQF